jgi:plastocyanin
VAGMRPSARLKPPAAAVALHAAFALMLLLIVFARSGYGAGLSVQVLAATGKPLRGAVLTLTSLETPVRHAAAEHAVMDQINRAFEPDLLIIPAGSTIQFINSDTVSHQIYSFSPVKRFQLPLYQGTPYAPVLFDKVGIVTLGCNIHDQMLAYVVVTDAEYFGRSGPSGNWSAEVPGGRYQLAIWHPRLREDASTLSRVVSISEGDPSVVTIRLTKPLQPAPLSNRPYSWEY